MNPDTLGPIGQAKADFAASKRDEARYCDTRTRDGEIYRKTWQQCRREAERAAEGLPSTSAAEIAPAAPEIQPAAPQSDDDVPDFIAVGPMSVFPASNEVEKTDTVPVEQKDTPEQEILPRKDAPEIGASSVRLAVGEEKPKKPEKKDPSQLDLFG